MSTWRRRLLVRMRPRRVWRELRNALTRNVGLKVLAILTAFALWLFVNFGTRDTEKAVSVPLELRNIPPSLMQVSPRIDFVDLRVRGPRTLLERIDPNKLSVVLDVGGVRPGPATFRIHPESLRLPRGVDVVRLTPSEITIEWARRLERMLPVRAAISGKPAGDLRITDVRTAPAEVRVIGPAEQVRGMRIVETEPIDLSSAAAGVLEDDVALASPDEYVSYSASLVHVQVRLEEPVETRLLQKVPVVLRSDNRDITVTPGHIDVTVRGPRSVVQALELDHGAVYIDATELGVGSHAQRPEIDLPADVEVVELRPPELTVVVPLPEPTRPGELQSQAIPQSRLRPRETESP